MIKRILVVMNTIDAGGAETFIMKVFRQLNKEKFSFDFLINKKDSNFYLEEIEKLGGKVFYGYSKSSHPIKCFSFMYNTVKNGGYDCVFNIMVHPVGFLDLLAQKMAGAKVRLVRSTNTSAGGKLSKIIAAVSRIFVNGLSTVMLAPSSEAGEWLFGQKATRDKKVRIITNGIDMDSFAFSEQKREKIRSELNIKKEEIVIGHIGRFNRQKNHGFLIDVFDQIRKLNNNAKLILVGEGDEQQKIQNLVNEKGLSQNVLFLGIRNDMPDLFAAMDIFVFPSLYEGMPNVIIEAQATGLPCLISDTITPQAKITPLVTFKSLEETKTDWAQKALGMVSDKRANFCDAMIEKGYSIEKTVEYLESCFEGISNVRK